MSTYHKNETITQATQLGLRTYIPEPNSQHHRKWIDKPEEVQQAVLNNRQRMSRSKGKDLQRQRSEKVERSFAHVCETGGARRTWLRGLEKINKRYLIVAAARNVGLLMLKAFGIGKPRGLQGGIRAILALWGTCTLLWAALRNRLRSLQARTAQLRGRRVNQPGQEHCRHSYVDYQLLHAAFLIGGRLFDVWQCEVRYVCGSDICARQPPAPLKDFVRLTHSLNCRQTRNFERLTQVIEKH
ncbi:transposase [Planctomicrobium sp. SH661]|uniref:transposase n=1 Tax=Planctomicrobium sp. SH661 TaxID=3448124 RepID=UPI003F5C35F2